LQAEVAARLRLDHDVSFMMAIIVVYLLYAPRLQRLARSKELVTLGDWVGYRFGSRPFKSLRCSFSAIWDGLEARAAFIGMIAGTIVASGLTIAGAGDIGGIQGGVVGWAINVSLCVGLSLTLFRKRQENGSSRSPVDASLASR
jgi:Na+/proline symporter